MLPQARRLLLRNLEMTASRQRIVRRSSAHPSTRCDTCTDIRGQDGACGRNGWARIRTETKTTRVSGYDMASNSALAAGSVPTDDGLSRHARWGRCDDDATPPGDGRSRRVPCAGNASPGDQTLDAVACLFGERGFEAPSTRDLSEHAGGQTVLARSLLICICLSPWCRVCATPTVSFGRSQQPRSQHHASRGHQSCRCVHRQEHLAVETELDLATELTFADVAFGRLIPRRA